jgi:hypothetical protein
MLWAGASMTPAPKYYLIEKEELLDLCQPDISMMDIVRIQEATLKRDVPIYPDGNQWCVLIGENLQEGMSGFGDTPKEALINLCASHSASSNMLEELESHAISWMKTVSEITYRDASQEKNIVLSFIAKIKTLRQQKEREQR